MNTASYYENASFLRELAERLPHLLPTVDSGKAELLQRLADEQLEQAKHDDWVRAKVDAARADKRPSLSTSELRRSLSVRAQELRNGL